jgi:hypothetical protein
MPAPTSYSHNLTVSLTLVLSLLGGGFNISMGCFGKAQASMDAPR